MGLSYKDKYNKEHYKQFKTYLKIKEYNKLKQIQKQTNMNNAEIIRWIIDELSKKIR